jgi:hypothetical protein
LIPSKDRLRASRFRADHASDETGAMGPDGLAFRLLASPETASEGQKMPARDAWTKGGQGMSIPGIGGTAGGAAQQKSGAGKLQSPEQTFLAYMKKAPVERWGDSWLAARGLTKEAFDALPPGEREALAKEMAEDLKKSGARF